MKVDKKALLKQYAPIVRYTKGEKFYPMRIDDFLKVCSLWIKKKDRNPEEVVSLGNVDMESVREVAKEHGDHTLYMRLQEEGVNKQFEKEFPE